LANTLENQKNLRFNTIVNLLDGGFFGFAMGFASFTTIIPLFIANLTPSAFLIGLIPSLQSVGWHFPQLFTARSLQERTRFKPFTIFATIHERLPFIGLALIAWFLPSIGQKWALILSFVMLTWQGLGGGITANPWQNLLGKVIPPSFLATFFGAQMAILNLMGSVGAIIAGSILENISYPNNYGLCFIIAGGLMMISMSVLASTREPAHQVEMPAGQEFHFWKNVRRVLKTDHRFVWFILSRIFFQLTAMSVAFFTVYAVKVLGMSDRGAGFLASILFFVQVGANVVFGWVADRVGRIPILYAGAAGGLIATLLAAIAPSASWFYVVVFFAGIANSVFWTIGITVSLEFGNEAERPTYVGLANTLIGPTAILAPLLGGWLADLAGYQATFWLASLFGLATIVIVYLFSRSQSTLQPALSLEPAAGHGQTQPAVHIEIDRADGDGQENPEGDTHRGE
jgi:MFS family permease